MSERHRLKRLTFGRYVLALPKSIYFNFRMLPLNQAWRLPILVSHRTALDNLSGKVVLKESHPKMGFIKIGFSTYQQTHFWSDKTRLNLRGTVLMNGTCDLGAGCSIEVSEEGVLQLDDHSHVGPNTLIICHKEIVFGPYTRCSWCCTFMDTDQHSMVTMEGVRCNEDMPIVLSGKEWIGCHVTMTKGTYLAPLTTVGAGSVVRGKYEEECTVISGNPAVVVRRGVGREDFMNLR